ncbi:hypothetical protein [Paenibacillus sp. D9]|uniref:hypothetical protein n=1 Tax=Paenibacillus sp. D9 TaxID=665792 RepID=UPI0012ED9412|nr:hypothetical protein [Paenibacillus sp. D9]
MFALQAEGETKGKRQKTKGKRQKTKDKRQKTKDKRQKTKDKRQKTKDKLIRPERVSCMASSSLNELHPHLVMQEHFP